MVAIYCVLQLFLEILGIYIQAQSLFIIFYSLTIAWKCFWHQVSIHPTLCLIEKNLITILVWADIRHLCNFVKAEIAMSDTFLGIFLRRLFHSSVNIRDYTKAIDVRIFSKIHTGHMCEVFCIITFQSDILKFFAKFFNLLGLQVL